MKKLLVALVGLSLFVASCGDDDATSTTTAAPATTTTAAPATTAAPTTTVPPTTTTVGALADIVLAEFAFTPDTVEASAGAELTANVTNEGSFPHSWTVLTAGTTVTTADEVTDDVIVAGTDNLAAGESATLTFTVREAGSYQIVCRIPGHIEAGMVGTLDVTG